jgi:hypothetical protein
LGQVVGGVQSKGMDMNAQPYGFVTEIKADTKETKGDVYLYSNWCTGNIEFINGAKLEYKNLRYNIERDFFEIQFDGIAKGSNGSNVKKFELYNNLVLEKYIQAKEFDFNNTKLIGFLRELAVGNYSLYSKADIKLIQGSYVKALDMGEEDDEYRKKITYFVVLNKKLIEINSNKKEFAAHFGEKEKEVLKHINDNKLSLKKEADLVKAVTFANNLVDPN